MIFVVASFGILVMPGITISPVNWPNSEEVSSCKFCCLNSLSELGENGSRSERVGECMGVQPCVSVNQCGGSGCLDQSSIGSR